MRLGRYRKLFSHNATVSHISLVWIEDGKRASLTWYRMLTDGRTEENKAQTCEHMLAYCKLDTLAMVEAFNELKKLAAYS